MKSTKRFIAIVLFGGLAALFASVAAEVANPALWALAFANTIALLYFVFVSNEDLNK